MPGFTRQIILHTLTELMNEKPLSKITVKDIVERCGVNRNTFYYHFRDIPDEEYPYLTVTIVAPKPYSWKEAS